MLHPGTAKHSARAAWSRMLHPALHLHELGVQGGVGVPAQARIELHSKRLRTCALCGVVLRWRRRGRRGFGVGACIWMWGVACSQRGAVQIEHWVLAGGA